MMSKYRNTVLYDLKFRFLVIFFSNYQHCLVWKILFPNHFFPKSRNTVLKIFISRPPANTVPLLIKTRNPKVNYGFGSHCNLCTLSGLCLFYYSNHMESPFPDVFNEILFLYASWFSPESV